MRPFALHGRLRKAQTDEKAELWMPDHGLNDLAPFEKTLRMVIQERLQPRSDTCLEGLHERGQTAFVHGFANK